MTSRYQASRSSGSSTISTRGWAKLSPAGFHQLHRAGRPAHPQRTAAGHLEQVRARGQVTDEAVDFRLARRELDDESIQSRIEHTAAGADRVAAQAVGVLRAHLQFEQNELALQV